MKKQAEKSGKPEEEIILEKNIVSEDFLFNLKSKVSNIPLKKVDAAEVPPEILGLIPEEASVNYKMASIAKTGYAVHVGMVYQEDIADYNALRFLSNLENSGSKISIGVINTL